MALTRTRVVCLTSDCPAKQEVPGDLYTPLMAALTLVAVLLIGMKTSGFGVRVRFPPRLGPGFISPDEAVPCGMLITVIPLVFAQPDSTLMGTAFASSFGYWVLTTGSCGCEVGWRGGVCVCVCVCVSEGGGRALRECDVVSCD